MSSPSPSDLQPGAGALVSKMTVELEQQIFSLLDPHGLQDPFIFFSSSHWILSVLCFVFFSFNHLFIYLLEHFWSTHLAGGRDTKMGRNESLPWGGGWDMGGGGGGLASSSRGNGEPDLDSLLCRVSPVPHIVGNFHAGTHISLLL